MTKSGDKLFTALKEIGTVLLPEEIVRKYPKAGTLVFNPFNGSVPKDHVVQVDKTIDVTSDGYVFIKFAGAAGYTPEGIGYQISVLKKNAEYEYVMEGMAKGYTTDREFSKHRWEYVHITDPVHMEHDDIDLAKQGMLETIDRDLIGQIHDLVAMDFRRQIAMIQAGTVVRPRWYLEKRKIIAPSRGLWGK